MIVLLKRKKKVKELKLMEHRDVVNLYYKCTFVFNAFLESKKIWWKLLSFCFGGKNVCFNPESRTRALKEGIRDRTYLCLLHMS